MSDSDEDFASADEGEVSENPSKGSKPQQSEDKKSVLEIKPDSKASPIASGSSDKQPQAQASSAKTKQAESAKGKKKGKKQDKKGPKDKSAEIKPLPPKKEVSKDDNKTSAKPEKKTPSEKTEAATSDSKKDIKKPENANTKTSSENVDKSAKGDTGDSEEQKSVVDEKPENTETETSKDVRQGDTNDIENASGDSNAPTNSETSDSAADAKTDPATLIKSPSSQSIARPKPDHTEEQESVLSKLADAATEKKSGWGWGWGSSLLNVASSSVTTFTNQVGEGFNTMIESVESTLNVPDPEEMAKSNSESKPEAQEPEDKESEESSKNKEKQASPESVDSKSSETEAGKQPKDDDSDSWFSAWGVSNITKMVENTSKTIVTGGLDVLETIGKKTFDVINEHDPGLKKTLGLVKHRGDKPNLSSTLREAKAQHEAMVLQEKESEEARKSHFGALFDEFQGLAHLEALEMLSNQSEKQVNTLLGAFSPDQIKAVKPQLLQIKQHFEMDEEEEEEDVTTQDFAGLVSEEMAQINVPMSPDKLVKVQEKISDCLAKNQESENSETVPQTKELHQQAIQSLAEFTSKAIEHFHKLGELVLLKKAELSDFTSTGKHLHSITRVLCTEVSIISAKFTDTLNKREDSEGTLAINQLVTNVYLEASNSSSYIQDGFQLLMPVLQQATMERCNIED